MDLENDYGYVDKPLSRGVAGRPLLETPALVGAKRGHIECDVNVDSLAYWNSPQGVRDMEFHSPFALKVSLSLVSLYGISSLPKLSVPLFRMRKSTFPSLSTEAAGTM